MKPPNVLREHLRSVPGHAKTRRTSQKSQQNILDGCLASCNFLSNTDWCSDGGGGRGRCPEAEQLHDGVNVYIFCPAVSTSYLVAFQAAPQARRHVRLHVSAAQTEFRQQGEAASVPEERGVSSGAGQGPQVLLAAQRRPVTSSGSNSLS